MDSSSLPMAQVPTSNDELDAYIFAQQLSTISVLPMIVHAAMDLGVFNVLVDVDNPGTYLSAEDVTAMLSLETSHSNAPTSIDRILRLLASYEIVACNNAEPRRYRAKPVCRYMIKNGDCGWWTAFTQDKAFMESWCCLKEALAHGDVPFQKFHGMTAFEYLEKDRRLGKVFNNNMANKTTEDMRRVLRSYAGFEGTNTLVNVGGGIGIAVGMIVSEHPTIKGINFDLPHVVADAPAMKGVEHVGGNMFEGVPSGDTMLLKNVLHDWSDEHCLLLLKKCWEALPKNGKVIVLEGVLPTIPDSRLRTKCLQQLDLHLMANSPGGRERTQKEYESLARKAGFSHFTLAGDLVFIFIIELFK